MRSQNKLMAVFAEGGGRDWEKVSRMGFLHKFSHDKLMKE